MGKETKIGLTVIGLLLSMFGLIVYLKVYRAEQGPTPEALAGALDKQPAATHQGDPLAGGPTVQLPAGADDSAPIELPSVGVDEDTVEYSAAPLSGEPSTNDPRAWNTPPGSSRRYSDVADAEMPETTTGDEVQPAEQYSAADTASGGESPSDARFGVLGDPNAPTDTAGTTDYVAEPADAEPPFRASPLAADESADPSAQPPYSDGDAHGEAIQVAAEEPVVEPPAELEESPASVAVRDAGNASPRRGTRQRASASAAAPIAEPNAYSPSSQPQSSTVPANFERPDESYTIEPNDNYWRISQKLYGTGSYFKALFEHNRQQFPRADRLQHGDVISAPPIDVLERTYPELCPRPQHRQVEEKITRAVSGRRLPRGGQAYVVEEGDTLFDIARYTLGQASRWGEIYDLNREVLGDQVDHLKPGMELILPASGQPDNVAREPAGRLR